MMKFITRTKMVIDHEMLNIMLWKKFEPELTYGTPEMAMAIQGVYKENRVLKSPVCMLGHTEGLLTWGKTKKEALQLYKDALMELGKLDLSPIKDN